MRITRGRQAYDQQGLAQGLVLGGTIIRNTGSCSCALQGEGGELDDEKAPHDQSGLHLPQSIRALDALIKNQCSLGATPIFGSSCPNKAHLHAPK